MAEKTKFSPSRCLVPSQNHEQAQLGVPHSRIQVELGFILQAGTSQILNFVQNPRQSQSVQGTELNWGGDTAQKKCIPGGGTPHILSEQGTNRGDTAPTSHWIC